MVARSVVARVPRTRNASAGQQIKMNEGSLFGVIVMGNQWPVGWMRAAFEQATIEETLRRALINQDIIGGIKLSVRPEAVLRDIQRTWLGYAVPAGVA